MGLETADLKDYLDESRSTNSKIFIYGMSLKARGCDDNMLEGYNLEFVILGVLINSSIDTNRVLCY